MASTKGVEYDAWWEQKWSEGVEAGQRWDIGTPHLVLVDIVQREKFLVNSKKVLVPGAGRGYDAVFLAANGATVEALDISSTAIERATEYLNKNHSDVKDRVAFKEVNFFEHTGSYDCGFDHTFLCAIHPTERQAWTEKWSELIKSGGQLCLIVYPLADDQETGPPWIINQSIISSLLSDGFELELDEAVPEERSFEKRRGKEAIMVWRKK